MFCILCEEGTNFFHSNFQYKKEHFCFFILQTLEIYKWITSIATLFSLKSVNINIQTSCTMVHGAQGSVSLCLVEAINLMIEKAGSANEALTNLTFADLRPWSTCSCSLSQCERLIKHYVITPLVRFIESPYPLCRSLGSFMTPGFLDSMGISGQRSTKTLQSLGTEHSSGDTNG